MHNDHDRAEELLNEALSHTPEQRPGFVTAACGSDVGLRDRVAGLVRAYEMADGFLAETPALSISGSETPGSWIGGYRLLDKIGEGGFGVVYRAEQNEPVKRPVALKVLKLGMDTRQVVARFEAERQALALMDHPNIARIFDGGATGVGRPFFVMELVRGVPITHYCDAQQLPVSERLRLFVQVCQAVQHAHQKGIIHRDLKPTNILVTVNDGIALPKVIDFGVAKATQQELTEKTILTQLHQFIGTPAYVSPEQAQMSSVDIDTRSDIYSLGVLLYELLIGRPPFDNHELLTAGLDEMRRIIREVEPRRPSEILVATSCESSAKNRSAFRHPYSAIPSDLDWVAMKCLEKDRSRRYETVSALAADIQRHLNHEPVLARPPHRAYRLSKFVRRHRAASIAAGAVLGAILLAGGIATAALIRERAAHQGERAARNEADQRLYSTLRFAEEVFAKVALDIGHSASAVQTQEKLAQATLQLLTDLRESANNPEVRVALAQALLYLSQIQGALGEGNITGNYESALRRAREAEQFFTHLTPDQLSVKEIKVLVDAKYFVATALRHLGRHPEAAATLKDSVRLLPYLEQSAAYRDWAPTRRIASLADAAFSLLLAGQPRPAEQELRAILETKWARGITTNSAQWDTEVLANNCGQLTIAYDLLGDFEQMIWAATNGIRWQQSIIDRFPQVRNTRNRACLAGFQAVEAHGLMRLARTNAALSALQQCRAAVDQLLREDSENEFARVWRVNVALNQARVYALWSDLPGTSVSERGERLLRAEAYLVEAEECHRQLKGNVADPLLTPVRAEIRRARGKAAILAQQPEHPPPGKF